MEGDKDEERKAQRQENVLLGYPGPTTPTNLPLLLGMQMHILRRPCILLMSLETSHITE